MLFLLVKEMPRECSHKLAIFSFCLSLQGRNSTVYGPCYSNEHEPFFAFRILKNKLWKHVKRKYIANEYLYRAKQIKWISKCAVWIFVETEGIWKMSCEPAWKSFCSLCFSSKQQIQDWWTLNKSKWIVTLWRIPWVQNVENDIFDDVRKFLQLCLDHITSEVAFQWTEQVIFCFRKKFL